MTGGQLEFAQHRGHVGLDGPGRDPEIPCHLLVRVTARDETQHRRVQRIEPCGELRVAAVHGEGILREIVGADREEIRDRREKSLVRFELCQRADGGELAAVAALRVVFQNLLEIERAAGRDLEDGATTYLIAGLQGSCIGAAASGCSVEVSVLALNQRRRREFAAGAPERRESAT